VQVFNLKRDATSGFTLNNHVGWVWVAQEKSTDNRYFVTKVAVHKLRVGVVENSSKK